MKKTLLLLALAGGLVLAGCAKKGESPSKATLDGNVPESVLPSHPEEQTSSEPEESEIPPVVDPRIEIAGYLSDEEALPYTQAFAAFNQGAFPENLSRAKASMETIGHLSLGEQTREANAEATIYTDGFEFAVDSHTDLETDHTIRHYANTKDKIAAAFSTGEENVALMRVDRFGEGLQIGDDESVNFAVSTPYGVIADAFGGVIMQFQLYFNIDDYVVDPEGRIYGIREKATLDDAPVSSDQKILRREWSCLTFETTDEGLPIITKMETETSVEGMIYYDFVPSFTLQEIYHSHTVVEFGYEEKTEWAGRADFLANFPEIIVDDGNITSYYAYPHEDPIRVGDSPIDTDELDLVFDKSGTQHGFGLCDTSMLSDEGIAFKFDSVHAYHVDTSTFQVEQVAWCDWDELPESIEGLPEGWNVAMDSYGALVLYPEDGLLDQNLSYFVTIRVDFSFLMKTFSGPQGTLLSGYAHVDEVSIEISEQH